MSRSSYMLLIFKGLLTVFLTDFQVKRRLNTANLREGSDQEDEFRKAYLQASSVNFYLSCE